MRKMELFSILFMYLIKGELIDMTIVFNGFSLIVYTLLVIVLTLVIERVQVNLRPRKRR